METIKLYQAVVVLGDGELRGDSSITYSRAYWAKNAAVSWMHSLMGDIFEEKFEGEWVASDNQIDTLMLNYEIRYHDVQTIDTGISTIINTELAMLCGPNVEYTAYNDPEDLREVNPHAVRESELGGALEFNWDATDPDEITKVSVCLRVQNEALKG